MNQFGARLRIQITGESHGPGIGVLLDGVPPGLAVDEGIIEHAMATRRPGSGPLVSSRAETDEVRIQSGVFEGKTTGAPVLLWIDNQDTRSQDYDQLRRLPRPGHSDLIANAWSHGFYDPRGGGHYSGRLTACLVAAAAFLRPLLTAQGIQVGAHVHQLGAILGTGQPDARAMQQADTDPVHTVHPESSEFVAAVEAARRAKDSLGGVIAWQADGVPRAWGDPFFDSVESRLAHLFFAVPAVKGVDFGAGFAAASMRGSEHNDAYEVQSGATVPVTNHAGGILGGRTTGAPIWGRVAIKPTSSIFQPQATVDQETKSPATLELKGRHDPCIAIRAAPVIRACVELVLTDFLLQARQEGHA